MLLPSVNSQNHVAAVIVFPDKVQEVVSFHDLENVRSSFESERHALRLCIVFNGEGCRKCPEAFM